MIRRLYRREMNNLGKRFLTQLSEPALILTPTSSKKLKEKCSSGHFLRIAVDGGGCSGFQYCFEMDDQLNEDDITIEENGTVKVAVDSESLQYIKGSVLDYQDELIRSAFRITENPNASKGGGCSCGASFNLDPSLLK